MLSEQTLMIIILYSAYLLPIIIAIILQLKCKNTALKITLQLFLFFPLAIYNLIKLLTEKTA